MKTLTLVLVITFAINNAASGQDVINLVVAESNLIELHIEQRKSEGYLASFYTDDHEEMFDIEVVGEKVILWDKNKPRFTRMGNINPESFTERKLLIVQYFRQLGFRIIDVAATVNSLSTTNRFIYLYERQPEVTE